MSTPVEPAFDDRTLLQIAVAELDIDRARIAWGLLVRRSGGTDAVLERILGGPSERLLPMLGARARHLDLGEHLEARCRRETDLTWGLNVRIFELIRPVLDSFRSEGVAPTAFKGLGLFGDVYPDHRYRACGDVDLLIHHRDVRPSLAVLAAHGWHVPWRAADPSRFGAVAITASHPSGVCVDLHLRPSRNLPYQRPAATHPVQRVPDGHPLADSGLHRLVPLHHLFVLALHGARPENRRIAHLSVDLYRAAVTWNDPGSTLAVSDRPHVHELCSLSTGFHVEFRVADVLARLSEVFDPAPLGGFGDVDRIAVPSPVERRAIAAEQRRSDGMDRGIEREPGIGGMARRVRDVLDVAGVGQGLGRRLELIVGYVWQKVLLVVAARRRHRERSGDLINT